MPTLQEQRIQYLKFFEKEYKMSILFKTANKENFIKFAGNHSEIADIIIKKHRRILIWERLKTRKLIDIISQFPQAGVSFSDTVKQALAKVEQHSKLKKFHSLQVLKLNALSENHLIIK